jgi:hypothetical protein
MIRWATRLRRIIHSSRPRIQWVEGGFVAPSSEIRLAIR